MPYKDVLLAVYRAGFVFHVLAVKPLPALGQLDFLDEAELQAVAGGNDSSVYTRIPTYYQLLQPLVVQVKGRLLCTVCSGQLEGTLSVSRQS